MLVYGECVGDDGRRHLAVGGARLEAGARDLHRAAHPGLPAVAERDRGRARGLGCGERRSEEEKRQKADHEPMSRGIRKRTATGQQRACYLSPRLSPSR